MSRGPYWPDTRTPLMIAPTLDATSGRSYGQASQTPGALGGRRAVVRWFSPGTVIASQVNTSRLEPTIVGGSWRIISVTGRVRVAPSGGSISFDILVDGPDHPAAESIFEVMPSIADGTYEAAGGVLKEARRYPVPYNTLHRVYPLSDYFFIYTYTSGGTPGEDLTMEMHYKVKAVSQ